MSVGQGMENFRVIILDIEHRDKAIEIIEILFPAIPYPKKKKKRD